MKKSEYIIAVIAIAAILLVFIYEFDSPRSTPLNQQSGGIPTSFELNNRTYAITAYANTSIEREKGLMNATVTNSTFMLFYFGQPGIYSFWMKDTYSQLDMIWLNYSNSTGMARVVYIVNATPCSSYSADQSGCMIYTPTAYANYVLEVKDGFVDRSGISLNESVRFLYSS